MANLEATGPNAEQITYWNEQAGPIWVRANEALDRQIGELGRIGIERAAPKPGERVLDVGCGCGDTVLQLADRVGDAGHVTGADLSTPMLELARERAAGRANVAFLNADAQTHAFDADAFDLLFSRFGVMFFTDPGAAFANLHRSLAPGGRLLFVCWQPLDRNEWMLVPTRAAAEHIEIPRPTDPYAPGPFAFADADRVQGLLSRAGFADVAAEGVEHTLLLGGGGGLESTARFMLQMGPAGRAVQAAGITDVEPIVATVTRALEPYVEGGGVRMRCAIWLLTARRASS